MILEDLKMDELRAIGYDLEALLSKEIKGSRKKDLLAEVKLALAELTADDRATLLEGHGVVNLDDAPEAPEPTENDPTELADEGGENLSGEPTDELEPGEVDAEVYEKAEADGMIKELPYAIQIREHASGWGSTYGDIIVNPSEELVESTTHAVLSEDGVKRLAARGSRVRKM
jgi:hypothetical protein